MSAYWFHSSSAANTASNRAVPRAAWAILLLSIGAGCASNPDLVALAHANHPAPLATNGPSCANLLGQTESQPDQRVSREFSVAVWNAAKVTGSPWREDLDWLTDDYDLVLVQEFALADDWSSGGYLSFAPGFGARNAITGVATLSRVPPVARCHFEAREPMLRTRKATSITSFPLEGGGELVVVNLHAVNFALGMVNFRAQLKEAVDAVAHHTGPLIFSGDFNTWRAGRVAIKEELLTELDLTAVEFQQDNRKRVFGQYLDHIYVRNLKVLGATTAVLKVSDHNPMFVRLGPEP